MIADTHTWTFRARCIRVIDGDTADLVIDQGMHTQRTERVRLKGVNAPEMSSKDPAERARAAEAKAFLNGALHGDQEWPLRITTEKDPDSFGRYLVWIWHVDGTGTAVNTRLVEAGLAEVRK